MRMERECSHRHVPVILVFDQLSHVLDFRGSQVSGDDSRAAWLVIQAAAGLGTLPTVVARCREIRNSKHHVERQGPLRALDRSQEDPLGVAFRKPFVVELDLRRPKHGDQEANDGAEKSRSISAAISA